jgi:ribosomal protein L11 methyltransferase
VTALDADVAAGALWSTGVVVAIEEQPGTRPGTVVLRAGLVEGAEPPTTVGPFPVRVVRVDGERWIAEERARAEPVAVGDRLVLVPPGHTVDAGGIELDHLTAAGTFGSGTHPTTRMALEALEQRDLRGRDVLDVGSGSGVLAIAAARLGAARVTAVDVDPRACAATRANAVANGVADRVTAVGDALDVVPPVPVDLVLANLTAGPLVGLAPLIVGRLHPGGVALLTGILPARVDEVVERYQVLGCRGLDRRDEDGWTLLVLGRTR